MPYRLAIALYLYVVQRFLFSRLRHVVLYNSLLKNASPFFNFFQIFSKIFSDTYFCPYFYLFGWFFISHLRHVVLYNSLLKNASPFFNFFQIFSKIFSDTYFCPYFYLFGWFFISHWSELWYNTFKQSSDGIIRYTQRRNQYESK